MPARNVIPAGHFPLPVYRARLKKLRAAIRAAGAEYLLVTNQVDVRYLSPFSGEASYALVGPSSFHILSDFRFQEELDAVRGLATVVIRKGDMVSALKTLLGDLKPRSVGIQADYASVAFRNTLAAIVGPKRLVDTSGLLLGLRVIKDDHELAAIRRSVDIQQKSLLATLKTIRPGQAEREIAARLEYEMKCRGSDVPAFESIVAAGANSSLPHARPGGAKVQRNGMVLIDWGAKAGGYCSDMTRAFALGKWPAKLAEIYKVVLEAHNAGMAAVRPGISGEAVDKAARDVIEKAGYGKEFGHGTGHGIGLDIHEEPRAARGTAGPAVARARGGGTLKAGKNILRPGMVLTVEPGIYLPGIGGIRIEDDILVTKRGGQGLCTLPKDLRWATLS